MATWFKLLTVVFLVTTLLAQVPLSEGTPTVTAAIEAQMREALRILFNSSLDTDNMRFMIAGVTRAIFHDCITICDGCIDMRRRVQPNNNGIEMTWKPLRTLWRKVFSNDVSFADFAALAAVIATEMAGEEAENVGACAATVGLGDFNDCKPIIPMVWGRRTCEHPQTVDQLRPLPSADIDPYEFHKDTFDMDERTTICLMGGHTLGKLRSNETGFNGTFTSRPESLDNEYYKILIDQENQQWKQQLVHPQIDGRQESRRQWVNKDERFAMTNSDLRLAYRFRPTPKSLVKCQLPPKTKQGRTCPKLESAHEFIRQLADNNKMFVNCYANAMAKLIRAGYEEGELVPTGVTIPTTTTTTTSTTTPTTTTKRMTRAPRRVRPTTEAPTTKKPRRQRRNRRQGRRRNKFGNIPLRRQPRIESIFDLL